MSAPEDFQWWHVLAIAIVVLLGPLFRAVAVVVVAKCVSERIAKIAIPLILHPFRLGFLSKGKSMQPPKKATQQVSDLPGIQQ